MFGTDTLFFLLEKELRIIFFWTGTLCFSCEECSFLDRNRTLALSLFCCEVIPFYGTDTRSFSCCEQFVSVKELPTLFLSAVRHFRGRVSFLSAVKFASEFRNSVRGGVPCGMKIEIGVYGIWGETVSRAV